MKRPVRFAVVLAVIAVLASGAYLLLSDRPAADDGSQALLALRLPDNSDQQQALSQWRGKIIVVNFWATWCAPCRKEIPEFSAVSERYADQPVQFVGISIDTPENIERFTTEHPVPYPLLIGTPQTLGIATQLGNVSRALPFTVIVARDGKIAHVQSGPLKESELEGKIRALLQS